MTNEEELMEILMKVFGVNGSGRYKDAIKAIIEAGYVKAEKVWKGIGMVAVTNEEQVINIVSDLKNIEVFVRVKE